MQAGFTKRFTKFTKFQPRNDFFCSKKDPPGFCRCASHGRQDVLDESLEGMWI